MNERKGPATALPKDFELPPQLKLWQSLSLTFLSATLLILSYQPFNLYGLAWIAFIPLIFAFRGRKDKAVYWMGCLFGFLFLLGSLFWLRTIHFSVPFLLALLWSPLWGFWAWFTKKMWFYLTFPKVDTSLADAKRSEFCISWKKNLTLILASSCIWVFLEWLRTWLFTGFPWNSLGISQAYFSPILTFASFFGVMGISLLIIFLNLSIAFTIEVYSLSKKFIWQLILIPVFIISVIMFLGQLPKDQMSSPYILKVASVQGNFPVIESTEENQEKYLEQIQTYRNLSFAHAADKPDLVIWPETAIKSSYSEDPMFQKAVKDIARICRSKVLFGSLHSEGKRTTNSAFLVDQTGKEMLRYDKIHLVPFGEYTPMKNLLPSSTWNWLNEKVNMGNLDSGISFDVVKVSEKFTAGINICFEDIFTKNSYEYVRSGANLLISISNDSWFEQSSGSSQHLAHSIFRAVEYGLPLIRCSTNSNSCLISSKGKVSDLILGEEREQFSRGSKLIELAVHETQGSTFYYRNPKLLTIFTSGIAFLAFLSTALHFFKRKSRLREIISGTD